MRGGSFYQVYTLLSHDRLGKGLVWSGLVWSRAASVRCFHELQALVAFSISQVTLWGAGYSGQRQDKLSTILRCSRYTKLWWVRKHVLRKYYYETDELPNPRPTQPKKKQVKSGVWTTFPTPCFFFVGWDWFYIR